MRRLLRIGLAIALVGIGLGVAVSFTDTYERERPDDIPGYVQREIDAAHRSVPLTLHMWYPTEDDVPPTLLGQNALFFGEHVRRDAAPAGADLPVVVLSHGSGGNAPRLAWLATRLATAGHLVVATNHPGATSGDSDPFQMTDISSRAADVSALLDAVERMEDVPASTSEVTVLGFSLGGATAMGLAGLNFSKDRFLAYCAGVPEAADCAWTAAAGVDHDLIEADAYGADLRDPRVTRAVLVDPAQTQALDPMRFAEINVPILVVNIGSEDVPVEVDAEPLAEALPDARYHAVAGPPSHFDFLAQCAPLGKIILGLSAPDGENICRESGAKPRAAIQAELAEVIVNFLE